MTWRKPGHREGVVADVISKHTLVGRFKSGLMVIVIVMLEVSVCLRVLIANIACGHVWPWIC